MKVRFVLLLASPLSGSPAAEVAVMVVGGGWVVVVVPLDVEVTVVDAVEPLDQGDVVWYTARFLVVSEVSTDEGYQIQSASEFRFHSPPPSPSSVAAAAVVISDVVGTVFELVVRTGGTDVVLEVWNNSVQVVDWNRVRGELPRVV